MKNSQDQKINVKSCSLGQKVPTIATQGNSPKPEGEGDTFAPSAQEKNI